MANEEEAAPVPELTPAQTAMRDGLVATISTMRPTITGMLAVGFSPGALMVALLHYAGELAAMDPVLRVDAATDAGVLGWFHGGRISIETARAQQAKIDNGGRLDG